MMRELQGSKKKVSKTKMLVIGNYILGNIVGEGTFGKVRLGTHIPTGEQVAIKILEKDKVLDLSDSERINRELHIMRLMRHPYIVDLYEIIETPKHLFIIMEYAKNGELYHYIRSKRKLSEKEGSKIFAEIVLGIEYIHKLGIVHRDLKPENLLLDYKNRVKIVDFGLSNIYRRGEQLKTACGSPCYAAPEMISGKLYDGINVDTWSCGVILYTLLCGCLPFEAESTTQVYDKILSGEFNKPDHLSKEAKDLLDKILSLEPENRIKIGMIKEHPFFTKYGNSDIKPSHGIIVGKDKIPIDDGIIKQMCETLGFSEFEVVKSLEANAHNTHTTTYKLLLKKRLLSDNGSKYDINSDNFDPCLLKKPLKSESLSHVANQKRPGDLNGRSSFLHLVGDKKKKKVLHASTGGTSSLDGKMGQKISLNKSQNNKSISKNIHSLDHTQINLDAGKPPTKKNTKKRKKSLYGKMRKEELLPKLDSRESSVGTKRSGEELVLEKRARSKKKERQGRRGKSPKNKAQKYNLNNILHSIHLKTRIQDRRKRSTQLGSLTNSQNEMSFLMGNNKKKRSGKKLKAPRKKKQTKKSYSISQRRNSNSRRSRRRKANTKGFNQHSLNHSRHHTSFLFDERMFKKYTHL